MKKFPKVTSHKTQKNEHHSITTGKMLLIILKMIAGVGVWEGYYNYSKIQCTIIQCTIAEKLRSQLSILEFLYIDLVSVFSCLHNHYHLSSVFSMSFYLFSFIIVDGQDPEGRDLLLHFVHEDENVFFLDLVDGHGIRCPEHLLPDVV